MVGDARGTRSNILLHIPPKHLQWQFLESLCEDKFVIQLGALTNQIQVSVNNSKSYGCTQSALNDHHIKITQFAHRLSQLSLFLN